MTESFDPDGPAASSDGLFGLPQPLDQCAVHVVGVPFEATTSFGRGTAGGPDAILQASWQVDLHDLETGDPWKQGIGMRPIPDAIRELNASASAAALPIVAAGGPGEDPELLAARDAVDAAGAQVNAYVHGETAAILDDGRIPGIVGGDHSVSFGAIQAAAERHPGIGLLHIDAHADLREAYEGFTWSHASILYNVLTRVSDVSSVVQVGLRDVGTREVALADDEPKLHWITDSDIARELAHGHAWSKIANRILAGLPEKVWITFDVDGLDPSLCPNTGTPVPGGLSWREATMLLAMLTATGRRIVGFDLVEVGSQTWDANVGARLLYKLAGHAIRSRR